MTLKVIIVSIIAEAFFVEITFFGGPFVNVEIPVSFRSSRGNICICDGTCTTRARAVGRRRQWSVERL